MKTPTTALHLEAFEVADDSVVEENRARAVRRQTTTSLKQFCRWVCVVALAPLLLATLAAAVVLFVARLLIELTAAGLDR